MNYLMGLTGWPLLFIWGLVLLHIQVFFSRSFVAAFQTVSTVKPAPQKKASASIKRCPFSLASQFFRQPTVIIANSILGLSTATTASITAQYLHSEHAQLDMSVKIDPKAWSRYHHIHHVSAIGGVSSYYSGFRGIGNPAGGGGGGGRGGLPGYAHCRLCHLPGGSGGGSFTSLAAAATASATSPITTTTTATSAVIAQQVQDNKALTTSTATTTVTTTTATTVASTSSLENSLTLNTVIPGTKTTTTTTTTTETTLSAPQADQTPSLTAVVASTGVAATAIASKKKSAIDALEVVCIGLSHHNAKVEVREKLAVPESQWNELANRLIHKCPSISEAAVLSTCNRFEIYLAGQNQYEVMKDAVAFLSARTNNSIDPLTLRQHLFMLSGEDAIWHLLRVSAGLDSLVVGEGQILAQVKKAYEHGIEGKNPPSGKVLTRLLNTAVAAGKRVRTETGISKGAVSISSAAAEFTAMKLSDDCNLYEMNDAKIVIIGAGKMSRLLLVNLEAQGVKKVTIVNRSFDRINELIAEFPGIEIEMKLMDELYETLVDADVVYPSTASETPIIEPEPLKVVLAKRNALFATASTSAFPSSAAGHIPKGGLHMVDISVPRNIHPDCTSLTATSPLTKVTCYNVDDLKLVVERNTAKRRKEINEAESILRDELHKYRLWQQSLGAIPTIAKLQEKAEILRQEEMCKAMKKLVSLNTKDLEIVEKITKGIVAKLLHGPMTHLKQQSEGGDATRLAIKQVQLAFQLMEN